MFRLGSLVLDIGDRWGDVAHPFQVADAMAVLDVRPEVPRRHYWTRPRGASKTTDLAGIGVAALLEQLPPLARAYAYAADRDQSRLLLESVEHFERNTPELGSALTIGANKVTASRSGASLTIESSDDASAWGGRPHFLIVDELSAWKQVARTLRLWQAITSAIPKHRARLVVLSMGGDPSHMAYRHLERARESSAWVTSEIPGPCPWWDLDEVAEARADMDNDTEYQRLILNRWVEGEGRLTTLDDVQACVGHKGPLEWVRGHRYVMGLDIGLVNDATVLTVAHVERFDDASVVVVDRQWAWQGSRSAPVDLSAVEAQILEAHLAYGRPPLVFDPHQAAHLTQRLRRRGVRVEAYNFSQGSISRLAATMYQLLSQRNLDLPDDEDLIGELAAVQLIERAPGTWRIDHERGAHDDRVISLALCAQHLLTGRQRGLRFIETEEVW